MTSRSADPGTGVEDRKGPGGRDGQEAVAAVARGELTVAAIVADAARRAAAWEPWLGAVVTMVGRDGAKEGPLRGLVTGVKDLIAVAGAPRLCGAPGLVDTQPQELDAPVVTRLLADGVHLLATLQTQPLAFGVVTPQTRNPRAPDRIAGGSSGGSAAAVAAGFVHAAVGSDTGGSVRIPAACCGVVGFKPTRGIIPLTGIQLLAWSLDTVGTLATSVADAQLLFAPMVGPDAGDPSSVTEPVLPAPDGPLRFGVPRELATIAIDDEIRTVLDRVLAELVQAGHHVVEVDLPLLPDVPQAHGRIISAEAAAMHRDLLEQRPDDLPGSSAARFAYGQRLTGVEVVEGHRTGVEFAAQMRSLQGSVDVVITPTLPTRVPQAGADHVSVAGREESITLAMTRLVNPWNLIGAPAGTVPAGSDADGGPIGVQLAGQVHADRTVLRAMAVIEDVLGGPWPTATPPAGGVTSVDEDAAAGRLPGGAPA